MANSNAINDARSAERAATKAKNSSNDPALVSIAESLEYLAKAIVHVAEYQQH